MKTLEGELDRLAVAAPTSTQPPRDRATPSLTTSVIIATGGRPEPLRETLTSLAAQTVAPAEVIIVDASVDEATRTMLADLEPTLRFRLNYQAAARRGAALQRNQGAALATSEIVVFLDDDVVLEPNYLEEVLRVFADDVAGQVGGVMGTIINQTYGRPGRLTRWFYRIVSGERRSSYSGRLIGPAINLLPEDRPNCVQEVEWLPSTAVAYRKSVFDQYRFGTFFTGYSFAEDVHLSARVARTHRLLNTTNARLWHKDLGGSTHRDWTALGHMQTVNRWIVMTDVLQRRRWSDVARFAVAQAFFLATDLWSAIRQGQVRQKAALSWGRISGCLSIALGRVK